MTTVESARGLFNDLLTLETNTVIKAGMTASKMPPPADAIIDILSKYVARLVDLNDAVKYQAFADQVFASNGTVVQKAGLDEIQTAAKTRILELSGRPAHTEDEANEIAEQRVLFRRIANNTQQLQEIIGDREVRAGTDLKLSADQATRLRKIWDIGDERVVLQSVMQIDGDYVTRVPSSSYVAEHGALLELHRAMVAQSVDHYGSLIKAVSDLLASGLKSFFGR